MATDFIIDMETLGQEDRSVILSIGLFPIPEEEDYTLEELLARGVYFKIERESQIKLGRIAEQDTINWWKAQGEAAREVLSSKDCWPFEIVHRHLMGALKQFGYDSKYSRIWSRGMIDQRWLQSLCKMYKLEEIPFWLWRDIRTILEFLTGSPYGTIKDSDPRFIKHNALHDCVLDYLRLKEAFENAQ